MHVAEKKSKTDHVKADDTKSPSSASSTSARGIVRQQQHGTLPAVKDRHVEELVARLQRKLDAISEEVRYIRRHFTRPAADSKK
jgi:hypothetical protein